VSTGNELIRYGEYDCGKRLLSGPISFGSSICQYEHEGDFAYEYSPDRVRLSRIAVSGSVVTNAVAQGLSYQSWSPTSVGGSLQVETTVYQLPHQAACVAGSSDYWYVSANESVAVLHHGSDLNLRIDLGYRPSAFEQLDEDRERRALAEADNARQALPGELGERVYRRLEQMVATARAEGPEIAAPAPDSVRAAIAFLSAMIATGIRVRMPSITLDSVGLVFFEWRNVQSGSAVVRFMIDGSVACSLTTYSIGRSIPDRWSAVASAEDVRRKVLDTSALRDLLDQ
jgi:hypothetical protein